MRLSIELNKANAVKVSDTAPVAAPVPPDPIDLTPPTPLSYIAGGYDWIPALKYAAERIQEFNIIAAAALVNGPYQCNPDATIVEGFLGATNTPPTEFGQVHIDVPNYRQRRNIPFLLSLLEDAFITIDGEASGEVVDEAGNTTVIPVGAIT